TLACDSGTRRCARRASRTRRIVVNGEGRSSSAHRDRTTTGEQPRERPRCGIARKDAARPDGCGALVNDEVAERKSGVRVCSLSVVGEQLLFARSWRGCSSSGEFLFSLFG